MMMRVCILAFLVFAAVALPDKKGIMKAMTAQLKTSFYKRDPGMCMAIKCVKEGDQCNLFTSVCQFPAMCFDNKCRKPAAGDPCGDEDIGCLSESLYCGEESKICISYSEEGDKCDGSCNINKKGINLTCDSKEKVCKIDRAKVGEPCEFGKTVCPEGSICKATSSGKRECVSLPSAVGEDCTESLVCSMDKYLYCDQGSGKCAELPKEGQKCYYSFCNKDLVCHNGDVCRKMNPDEGEYCGFGISCAYGYKCLDNKCVKPNGTCVDDEDCKNTDS